MSAGARHARIRTDEAQAGFGAPRDAAQFLCTRINPKLLTMTVDFSSSFRRGN